MAEVATTRLPKPGSYWVWEIDAGHARALIEVRKVFWNGEEWWVRTRSLLPALREKAFTPLSDPDPTDLNCLSRFWEAVTPVGGPITTRVFEMREPSQDVAA